MCCITGELLGGGLCDQWVCNGIFITYRIEKFSDRSRAGSWKYSGSYITAVCCSGGGPCKTGNFTTNDCRDGNCHNPAADSDAVYVKNGTGNRAVILIVNMLLQVVQPLINSISLYYVNHGIYVDFGIGRGVGSASYAVAASFLGILIGRYYGLAIMAVGCLSFAVMFVTLISMPVVKDPNESKKEEQKNTANRQRGGGILEFARRYRNYMLVLLGMILIYVESTYVNNYLINIVVSLGGDIKRMGTLLTVSAMSELPTMLLFSRLVGKWDSRKLIRFAAVMFSVKALGYLVCGSISFLYVVQMLQMLSFALCLPSAVYYVNETMAVEDRVKGQSLLIASSTMGGVFGSLSGGVLVDFAGIKAMLATGLGLSMIGTAIVCIFVSRKDN